MAMVLRESATPRGPLAARRVKASCSVRGGSKALRPPRRGPSTLRELWAKLEQLVPELVSHTGDAGAINGGQDGDRPVVLLASVGGARRALRSDTDVQDLFLGRSPDSCVEIEVRPLFPASSNDDGTGCSSSGLAAPRLVAVPVSGSFSGGVECSIAPGGNDAGLQPRPPSKPRWAIPGVRSALSARPQSAPSAPMPAARVAARCHKEMQRQQPQQQPEYDGRPGRRLDGEWAGRSAIAAHSGTVSGELLDSFGLREEYERLRTESRRRRSLLEQLLRARDNVPGSQPMPPQNAAATAAAPGSTFAAPPQAWQKGEFCLVAARDVPKLQEAIESLVQIEDLAAVRLQDEGATVTWRVTNAARRLAEERRLAVGRPMLLPRRVMAESPWLRFAELGQVAFRFLPQGDASSADDGSTIYVWMAAPPPVSFTFCIRIGTDSFGNPISSAPRLWRSDVLHYRVDVDWAQIQVALMVIADRGEEHLEISLVVLQWHGPAPATHGCIPDVSPAASLHVG